MTPVEIILAIVRGISTLSHNPALGGGGVGSQRTSALLDMFATLFQGGEATWADMKAFAVEIQALVDANGEPSRGQWDAMIARDMAARKAMDENLAQIQQEMQTTLHPVGIAGSGGTQQTSGPTGSISGSAAPALPNTGGLQLVDPLL